MNSSQRKQIRLEIQWKKCRKPVQTLTESNEPYRKPFECSHTRTHSFDYKHNNSANTAASYSVVENLEQTNRKEHWIQPNMGPKRKRTKCGVQRKRTLLFHHTLFHTHQCNIWWSFAERVVGLSEHIWLLSEAPNLQIPSSVELFPVSVSPFDHSCSIVSV